ncbi:MAG: uracil-DNA glycosylase [Pseudomonadota bacterium]
MANVLEIMEWYVDAGVDIMLEDAPIDRFAETETLLTKTREPKTQQPRKLPERKAQQTPARVQPTATMPDAETAKAARELAVSAASLEDLQKIMTGFDGCNLKRTAKTTVFADGNPASRIMFIGEAPGRDEDIQGLPFVGRAGQLLDRMLAAINLTRENAYITNVIPWRPPGNRTPTPQETEICRPFIERHIELIQPELIVMLGGSSAKTLLKTTDGIMRLRGKWTEVVTPNSTVKSMPTLHPAYLLRQPAQKRLAWQDFLQVRQFLEGLSA